MRSISNLVALVLIAVGIVFVSYAGFSYTTEEKIAEIGPVTISSDERKHVPFSPIIGGICIAVGVVILLANRKRR